MFKVEDIKKSNELTKGKSIRKVDAGESFSDYLKAAHVSETQKVQATSVLTPTEAIFAAQTVSDEEERQIKQKMLKKGNKLLSQLEEIRDGILFGEISKDKLIEISRFVKQKETYPQDEKLQEILGEIELRVEVELAKLMKSVEQA